MTKQWASGGPRSPAVGLAADAVSSTSRAPPASVSREGSPSQQAPSQQAPSQQAAPATAPARRLAITDQAAALTAEWAPAAGRILLGVVFAWFGYHELLQPGQWTQYVPVISESSSPAIIAVLVHGWILLVLAAALVAGIAPRAAAAIASVLMLEIVIALVATGLSDTALRDVGVLGLAVCLTGVKHQRLVLRD
jgi:uncharacterized membrane protein YphA (DoxX/SURF4 family)